MTLSTGPIQSAAIARYRADTTLQGLLVGSQAPLWNIYDANGVPTNTTFPYVVLYQITVQSGTAMTFAQDGQDVWTQVSVFTQTGADGGFSQARGIAKRVYDLTNRQPLDLSSSGLADVFLMFEASSEEPQPDGITQHIPMRFKHMTQG